MNAGFHSDSPGVPGRPVDMDVHSACEGDFQVSERAREQNPVIGVCTSSPSYASCVELNGVVLVVQLTFPFVKLSTSSLIFLFDFRKRVPYPWLTFSFP
jgi:hypothetical protein